MKVDPSMPGIVVAKVALMLLQKCLYHFAQRPPSTLYTNNSNQNTHSYLQNLEEHLLNCFPKDRSYPAKTTLVSKSVCVTLPTYTVEYKLSTIKLRPSK